MTREISPTDIAPPAANYAHAVLTEGASRWLHTSGVVPVRPDGSVPDDVGEQAEVVWTNIGAMLDEAGMRSVDVVSVTTYVVVGEQLGAGDGGPRSIPRRPPRRLDARHRAGARPARLADGGRDHRRGPLTAYRRDPPRVVR